MSNPTSSYGIVTVLFMLKVKWGCAFWFHLLLDFSEKQWNQLHQNSHACNPYIPLVLKNRKRWKHWCLPPRSFLWNYQAVFILCFTLLRPCFDCRLCSACPWMWQASFCFSICCCFHQILFNFTLHEGLLVKAERSSELLIWFSFRRKWDCRWFSC